MELPPSLNWDSIINGGAVVMICYVFWHGLTKGLPSIISGFTAEMQAARKDFREALTEVVDHCREEAKATAENILKAAGLKDQK